MPRALLSVSDKKASSTLPVGPVVHGFELVSTGSNLQSQSADGVPAVVAFDSQLGQVPPTRRGDYANAFRQDYANNDTVL